ncbi:MAG: hypothetical protein IPO37_19325 [Saprospiraceae bacterium]|nr:hypothetical protein [Saprospiraceae bacterium]
MTQADIKNVFQGRCCCQLHDKKLPGKPDIILSKYKTIIVEHSYFCHGHEDSKYLVGPITKYWTEKINKNKDNDEKNEAALVALGWKMISGFWL